MKKKSVIGNKSEKRKFAHQKNRSVYAGLIAFPPCPLFLLIRSTILLRIIRLVRLSPPPTTADRPVYRRCPAINGASSPNTSLGFIVRRHRLYETVEYNITRGYHCRHSIAIEQLYRTVMCGVHMFRS